MNYRTGDLLSYLRNTSWLFFERGVKLVISFTVIILLTRYLGPDGYGKLSFAQSLVGMITAFASLGLDAIVVRELKNRGEDEGSIIGTAIGLRFLTSIVAIALLLLFAVISDDEAGWLAALIGVSVVFQAFNLLDAYFQANVISKYSALSNSLAFFISSSFKLLLIFHEAALVWFGVALVIDSILIAGGYLLIYSFRGRKLLRLDFNIAQAKYFLSSSWPLALVAMAAFLYTRTDQVMIKYILGDGSVGIYSSGVRVVEVFYLFPLLVTQSLFPKFIEKKTQSEENYLQFLEHMYRFLFWASTPLSLFLCIFGSAIVDTLYTSEFHEAGAVLSVLSFSVILTSMGAVTTKILYVENYEKKYLYRSGLGVLVNCGLNFLLIPKFGVVGAAYATVGTLFFIYYLYDLVDADMRKFFFLKIKILIPSGGKRRDG